MVKKELFTLLFGRPLYDYAVDEEGEKQIRVLIDGEDELAEEAFQAVFSCAQMPKGYMVSITILCGNAKELQQRLCAKMPGLSLGLSDVQYTCVSREDFLLADEIFYEYILLCDAKENHEMLLRQLRAGALSFPRKMLVCLLQGAEEYEATSFFASCEQAEVILPNNAEIFEHSYRELERYAYNCDFAYSMGVDEYCAKKDYAEFQKEDMYNHMSSFAFCVHIPYKLHFCAQASGEGYTGLEALEAAIQSKNSLYYRLLDLEHRRWMAYMIGEGWTMPSDEQLNAYAYVNFGYENEYTHQNKQEKLHPCLCRGSENGCNLSHHNELWKQAAIESITTLQGMKQYLRVHYPDTTFSDLEAISLVLYTIANKKSYAAIERISEMFEFVEQVRDAAHKRIYTRLIRSMYKLKRHEDNAAKLFEDTLVLAKEAAEADGFSKQIREIEQAFKIVVERAKRKNFFMIDSVMIDMIPFCLWYGKENKTVLTVCSDIPAVNVIVPTMLSAETAVFLAQEFSPEDKHTYIHYFAGRNQGTNVRFIEADIERMEAVSAAVCQVCEQYEAVALNATPQNHIGVTLSMGLIAQKSGIPILSYIPHQGILQLKNGRQTPLLLAQKSLSVGEYVMLLGGNYSNVYTSVVYFKELEVLESLYMKYSKEIEVFKNNRKKVFCVWNTLSVFFQTASKNKTYDIESPCEKSIYRGDFSAQVFHNCGIGDFLRKLQEYRIIEGYQKTTQGNDTPFIHVQFAYYDKKLAKLLDKYTWRNTADEAKRNQCLRRRLSFSAVCECVNIFDLQVQDVQLFYPEETAFVKKKKLEFIQDLCQSNMIHSVSFSPDKSHVSLSFSHFLTMQTFKNQGKLLEVLLYNKLKNSFLFDDVQTGVEIAWDSESYTFEDYLQEELESSTGYGYANFSQACKRARKRFYDKGGNGGAENEIDIIAMSAMTPVFISCKTSKQVEKEELYEIASIAEHFHASPVLAVIKDLDEKSADLLLSRARQMGVSLIGSETIFNPQRMQKAMEQLARGAVVFGRDTNEKTGRI